MKTKQKKCRICGEKFTPHSTTARVCSLKCALILLDQQKEKKKQHDRKVFKATFLDNDRKHQLKLTQATFNKMRRLEELLWFKKHNETPYCISCGKTLGGDQWCCGHLKTVGANSSLRFDRKNTYLQHNVRCNKNLSGDIEGSRTTRGYKKGLLLRFGTKEGQQIIDYCDIHNETMKYTCEELREMRKEFNAEIRKLEAVMEV